MKLQWSLSVQVLPKLRVKKCVATEAMHFVLIFESYYNYQHLYLCMMMMIEEPKLKGRS